MRSFWQTTDVVPFLWELLVANPDDITALNGLPMARLAREAGHSVADIDPCLLGFKVEHQIRITVPVYIFYMPPTMGFGTVALVWVLGITEANRA